MSHIAMRLIVALAMNTAITLLSTSTSLADARQAPRHADSPYDVINAVNALRTSYGMPPYSISSILMSTAQNHADYMAATGNVSHTGVGDLSVTDRLLAAGYPLAGDLSLGGFRSENITSGNESMSAQAAVDHWTGDAVHLNTMISANLSEIGAGVTVNGGRVYYVIDCALPTTNGIPQAASTPLPGESTVPARGSVIIPVVVATPNADGDLIHDVKAGQSLWQIAIAYNTTIDEIKRLNNLFDNDIYPGAKLLINRGVFITPVLPTGTANSIVTFSPTSPPTAPVKSLARTMISTPLREGVSVSTNSTIGIVMGIIAVAILGGGIVAWLGAAKK